MNNITHHFAGGTYAKETRIPAGARLEQHSHRHAHLAILASGTARVFGAEAESTIAIGPCCLTLAAHVAHGVEALSDLVWLCVWATEDTDPTTVDSTILKGN